LGRERQELLEAAGLVGLEFCAESIAPALGLAAEAVEELLDGLAGSAVFVDRHGIEAWPDGTRSARYRFRHPLYQQLWAERTAPQRRQRLHLGIGERLERAHAAHAEEVAAELALHFSEGGDVARATGYRLAAAHNAIRRSAHREAVDHLAAALLRLTELPGGSERDYQELGLRIVLGMALTAISGYTAAKVEENYRRSLDLSDRLGDAWQIVQALLGLCPFYLVRGELAVAQRLAERCAREIEPSSELGVAVYNALGATALWRGELTASRGHLERSAALHDPDLHASSVLYDATNPEVACLAHLAWVLWTLGFPDGALQRSREAIARARHLAHAYSLSYALTFGATLHVFRREPQIALEHADEALGLADEHDFPFWQAMGSTMRGWALAVSARSGDGLSLMRQGVEALDVVGANVGRTALLALLAEACDACGEPAEGLRVLREAEATVDRGGERFYAAEILRVRAELLLRQDGGRIADSARLFLEAMDVARRQKARSWELRSAISLARLRRRGSRRTRARERLAPVYGWFREGFGTRDLIEAKALLEEPGP
jgi:predicted ATPase